MSLRPRSPRSGPAHLDPSPASMPQGRRPARRLALLMLAIVSIAVAGPLLFGGRGDAAARLDRAAPTAIAAESGGSSPSDGEVPATDELTPLKAGILGLVEGVTEFLPVSSTGHLTVVERWLGIGTTDATKSAADAYAIVIQAGAILAVIVLYWRRLVSMANGLIGRDEAGRRVLISLVLAFLPAAVVGVALEKPIKAHLFGVWPVVAAWVVGGIVLLVISSRSWLDRERQGTPLESMAWRTALIIGVAQCLALWPGTSRSLVTIVAGVLVGLSLSSAVEFSFLLGLVTLGAATSFDALRHGDEIVASYGVASPLIGFVVAFVAAVVAVRWMVGYLQSHSLALFGWYRLGIAALAVGLVASGSIAAT